MTRKNIIVLGAGGMARETAYLIREVNRSCEKYTFLGYVVSDSAAIGKHDDSIHLLGDYNWVDTNAKNIDAVAIGIGSPLSRLKVFQEIQAILPAAEWPSLIHPSAIFDPDTAIVGPGALVCAGVIGTVSLTLGALSICNFGCTLGHEVEVGEASVISPGVNVSGAVKIGRAVMVGTGAQILQYLTIGDEATVGAGAVVVKDVAAKDTVVGVPARSVNRGH